LIPPLLGFCITSIQNHSFGPPRLPSNTSREPLRTIRYPYQILETFFFSFSNYHAHLHPQVRNCQSKNDLLPWRCANEVSSLSPAQTPTLNLPETSQAHDQTTGFPPTLWGWQVRQVTRRSFRHKFASQAAQGVRLPVVCFVTQRFRDLFPLRRTKTVRRFGFRFPSLPESANSSIAARASSSHRATDNSPRLGQLASLCT